MAHSESGAAAGGGGFSPGQIALSIGGSLLGGYFGRRAAKKAARANAREQARALAFQKQMRDMALQQIELSQVGAMDRITATGEGRMGDTLSRLAGSGFNPGTSVGLGAMRATKMDTRNAIAQMASQMAQQRAAVYSGQSYPMIQHEAQGGQGAGMANLAMMLGMMGQGGSQGFSPSDAMAQNTMMRTGTNMGLSMLPFGMGDKYEV